MRIYGFTEKGEGFTEIENTLKSKQEFVNGYIEYLDVGNGIDLICNEEGLLRGMMPRVAVRHPATVIVGDCFVCRHDDEGNFTDILESDLEYIKENLRWISETEVAVTTLAVVLGEMEENK